MTELLLTATLLMAAVLLVRATVGWRLSMGLRYALWGLVLARLLIPVQFFSSPVSVLNVVSKEAPPAWGVEPFEPLPAEGTGVGTFPAPADGAVAPTEEEPLPRTDNTLPDKAEPPDAPPAPTFSPPDVRAALTSIWGAGAAAAGLYFLCSNLRFYGRLRRSKARVEAEGCPIPVYRADCLPAPCLAGLLRPSVCVPGGVLGDPVRLGHVLAHELCHLRHGDNWWALLRCVCLCLWWFHPLVWVCAVLSRRDCELACDEAAVKRLGEGQRVPYGETLVALVSRPGGGEIFMAATAMTAGKKEMRERVVQLVQAKRMTRLALTVALSLAALIAAASFTGAVAAGGGLQFVSVVETDGDDALPLRVEPDPALRVDDLDLRRVAVPDFEWNDGPDRGKPLEQNLRWMYLYGQQFYALPEGHPYRSTDVFLYATRNSWVTLAVKPVGGIDAVRDLFKGGVPRGTGEFRDYVLMEYHIGGLRPEVRADGSTWWTGYQDDTTIVIPVWHRNPPPETKEWTDELEARWRSWLPAEISILETDGKSYEEIGLDWANNYTERHKTMSADDGNPLWSDDVKVLAMELEAAEPEVDPQTLVFHLRYAFRPVWGLDNKVRRLVHSGKGTGDLEGYAVVDAQVILTRVEREVRGKTVTDWKGAELVYQYGSNYDNGMNLSLPLPISKPETGETYRQLTPIGIAVSYPKSADETKLHNAVPGRWAMAFGRQLYRLSKDHPLLSDWVEVASVSSFYPRQITPSGMEKIVNEFTIDVLFHLHPTNGMEGAAEYLGPDCYTFKSSQSAGEDDRVSIAFAVTITRGNAADGSVTWAATAAKGPSRSSYDDTTPPQGAVPALPIRVKPRMGYAISALDYLAAYVPDDGKHEDILTRWAVSFAQQFYALPEENLWRASDVIVRDIADGWVSLAVKPVKGIARLEEYFPGDPPKGKGELEGYLYLQYNLTLNRQRVAAFGAETVWSPEQQWSVQPLWVNSPYEIGSKAWNRALEEWTGYLRGGYVRAEGDAATAQGRSALTEAWAKGYLRWLTDFGSFGPRHPALAEDVKLLSAVPLGVSDDGSRLRLTFEYAMRPMWDIGKAEALYQAMGGCERGTGDLEGYLVCAYPAVELVRSDKGNWSVERLPHTGTPMANGWIS